MAEFDGSIYAYVGADIKDYQDAMNKIAASTQQAFQKAQDAALNSSNSLLQKVGQIMSKLASNNETIGQRLGHGISSGLNMALGKVQQMASKIAEKIPQPIKNGFDKVASFVQPFVSKITGAFSALGGKIGSIFSSINAKITKAFGFDIAKAIQSPSQALNQLAGAASKAGQRISSVFDGVSNKASAVASRLPAPFSTAFNAIATRASATSNDVKTVFNGLANALGRSATSQVASSWSNAFNKISSSANQMTSNVLRVTGSLGNGFSNLSSKATSVLTGISSKFANAQSAGEKLASTVKSIVSAFSLMAVANKTLDVLKSSLDGAISRVDTMNRFPKTMALFGYSAEQSKGAIDKLSAGIEGLPTPLDSAVKSAQQLAITTGSLEKGTDLALAFNNAMIGYGANTVEAEQALRQFNQSLGSGKIQAEEFNSVSEAAPGLMAKMSEAFGFGSNGVQDLKAALKDGKITAQQFADKMIELNGAQGGFAEMAQASAGGIRTSFQNLKTAVVKGVANMITSFDEAAKANGLKTISESLMAMKPAINGAFETVNALIPNLVASFARIKNSLNIDTSKFTGAI